MRKWSAALLAGATCLAAARGAGADPSPADVTFARGRELMKAKKYEEACAAFQQSQQLDPQFGTLYNLAQCEEQIGKLASAWTAFRQLALSDTNAQRKAAAAAEAKALEARVPKLVVTVPKPRDGMVVKLDDEAVVVGLAAPIDLGSHEVTAVAAGGASFDKSFDVSKEATTTTIEVKFDVPDAEPEPEATPAPARPVVVDKPAAIARDSRTTAKVLTIAGGATTIGGLVVGGLALHNFDLAKQRNDVDLSSDAVALGNVSTGLVVAGLVAAGVGVYLWRRGPHVMVTPAAGGGAAVSLSGQL